MEEYDHPKSGGRDENNTPSDLDRKKIPAANGRKYVTVPNGVRKGDRFILFENVNLKEIVSEIVSVISGQNGGTILGNTII